MKTQLTSLAFLILTVNLFAQSHYQNDTYGYSGQVPNDWTIYADIKDDTENHNSILDWGLPKVYSKLEKTSIENAISITAYKRSDIKNIDDLMKFEFNRVGSMLISKKAVEEAPYISYVLLTLQNGLNYKTRVSFVFKNNIGYVLIYTATLGTYDINLPKYTGFVKDVQFFEPKVSEKKLITNSSIHFNGLYVAKTGEVLIPNNKIEIYNYIRFYDDGTVYTQAISSYDPSAVSKWFAKNGRFERKGEFKITGDDVEFAVSNNESPDKKLEDAKTDKYIGKVTETGKLMLTIKYADGVQKDISFGFVKFD